MRDSAVRRYAVGAALMGAVLLLAGPPAEAKGSGFTPHQLPGFEHVPWTRLQGDVGKWVRYRIGNEFIQETSFMTLAVVGREDDGGLWLEVRIGRIPDSQAVGGLTVRMLLQSGGDGDLVTERVLIRLGGGQVVEIDLDTVPPNHEEDDDYHEPPMKEAGVCVDPSSHACMVAQGRGLGVRPNQPETMLTAAGSMRVHPVEIQMDDGDVIVFRASDAVPITGLVSAQIPDGTHMELDGIGEGAQPTVTADAEVVAYDNLTAVMGGGSAAIGASRRLGQLVNPDDARRHAASHGIEPDDPVPTKDSETTP